VSNSWRAVSIYRVAKGVNSVGVSGVVLDEMLLEFESLLTVRAVVHVEVQVLRVNASDERFDFSEVRMTRVWNFEVEGEVPVVFVIPPCKNNEDGTLVLVQLFNVH